jgi:hypothetical protein
VREPFYGSQFDQPFTPALVLVWAALNTVLVVIEFRSEGCWSVAPIEGGHRQRVPELGLVSMLGRPLDVAFEASAGRIVGRTRVKSVMSQPCRTVSYSR